MYKRQGLNKVEAGAQGEHKIARGYVPTETFSLHWIGEESFSKAVGEYLLSEKNAVKQDIKILSKEQEVKSKFYEKINKYQPNLFFWELSNKYPKIILDLIDGNSVKLTSFGTFSVKHKKERIGRNPKTKEEAIIDARRVISFRASKELKRRVNS